MIFSDKCLHEALRVLWRRRNSTDPRLRAIARALLRADLLQLRGSTKVRP